MVRQFQFIKYRKVFYSISLAVILSGVASMLIHGGLKLGIDFAGGNVLQVSFTDSEVAIGRVREVLAGTGYGNNVQKIEDPHRNVYILRTRAFEKDNARVIQEIRRAFANAFGEQNVSFDRIDIVGPKISKYLLRTSYIVLTVAIGLILLYVAVRFRFRMAVTAVLALVHDVLVMLAFISLFGKEMDTFLLAAILTIIGYSINDTIVVYDRARENLKSQKAQEDLGGTFNASINQTLSRTLLTSGTTLAAMLALYFFGGRTTRDFAFALIVGTISGSYSTIFVASSLVYDWHRWKPEKFKKA